MLSWSLWRTIRKPALEHPVFRRANIEQRLDLTRFNNPRIMRLLRTLLVVFALVMMINDPRLLVLAIMWPALAILFILTMPLLLPFIIFAYGLLLVIVISNSISIEKESYTYDLLCVSPGGSLDISWSISSGVLYRGQTFIFLHIAVRIVLTVALIVILFMAVILIVIGMFQGNATQGLPIVSRTIIEILSLSGIFYTGYTQSMVLSIIIGLLTPHYDINRRDVQLAAIISHFTIQLGTYLTAFLLVVPLNTLLHGHNIWLDLLLPPLYFIIFYGIRELTIFWLWRQIIYRLNAAPAEGLFSRLLADNGRNDSSL